VDADRRVILRDKHLLSIRDLDLSDHLEAMADAGIQSFKIEGRLKDADYVKNVVSHLRRKLDALLARRPELGRASLGAVSGAFTPDPAKTFQRGLSTYRIEGERQPMGTPDAPKHLGEFIGEVRSIQGDRLVLDPLVELHPGDGLAFVDGADVAGTVLNAVDGRQLFVQEPSRIRVGTRLHRNLDLHWLKALRSAKVERRIPVAARLDFPQGAARLGLEDPTGLVAEAQIPGDFAAPRDGEAAEKAIREALGRLGNTPFALSELRVSDVRFVPASALNALRREAAAALEALRRAPRAREPRRPAAPGLRLLPTLELDYTWNIANKASRAFYQRAGGTALEPAAELQADLQGKVVMTTRHCVRYELGWCAVHANPEPWTRLKEPQGALFLENGPTRLECRFDCARCRMELVLGGRREPG
jgi:putative protease